MANPSPPSATYALMGTRVGYSDGNPLTTALLNQLAAYLVAQDGNGNVQEILSLRVGPNAFVLADPAGTVWVAYNAFFDSGSQAWYPVNTGQASYAVQITSASIAFQYSAATSGAGALTWQVIDQFTSTGLNSIIVANATIALLQTETTEIEASFSAIQTQMAAVLASLAQAGTLIFASSSAAQASGSLVNGAYYYIPSTRTGGALDLYKKISSSSSSYITTLPSLPTTYGLVGDGVTIADAAISLSAPTIVTSPSGIFATAVGGGSQLITVVGAGSGGTNLNTAILSVQSANQVTVATGASTAVSGASGCFGTDNSAALLTFRAAALAFNASNPGIGIAFPSTPGATYHFSNPYWPTGIKHLECAGPIAFRNISDDPSGFDSGFTIWCGGLGYMPYLGETGAAAAAGWVVNDTPYPIQTSNSGSSSVTLSTPAAASTTNFPIGNKCILACQTSYIASTSPPSMRTFEYLNIESANPATGVIGLNGETINTYLSTLPTNLMSANFRSAAQIFPLLAIFDAPQNYYDVEFLPSINSTYSYLFVCGTEVNHYNCRTTGGVVPSNCIKGRWKGGKISALPSPNNVFEIDHLNVSYRFEDVEIEPLVAINAPTSDFIEFVNCQLTNGIIRCFGRIELNNTTINGTAQLFAAQAVRAVKSRTSLAQIFATAPGLLQYITIDGTDVIFTPATTTEPDIIQITAANVQANGSILNAVFTGASLKMFASFSSIYVETGTFFYIDSLTSDGSGNMYFNGTLYSNYCSECIPHAGAAGSGFTTGDTVASANGATFSVTASGGAVTALTATQPYVTTRAFSAVGTTVLTGEGAGLTVDMNYGLPTNATFEAPEPTYYGDSNPNGDIVSFTSYGVAQPAQGAYAFFPNGDTDAVRGNRRKQLISPTVGQGISFTANWCGGHVKSWSVEVVRSYTGSAISGALTLTATKYAPASGQETPMVVNLREEGRRVVTEVQALGAQSGDTLKSPSGFFGGYSISASAADWSGVFASPDTRAELPMVLLEFEMYNPVTVSGQ